MYIRHAVLFFFALSTTVPAWAVEPVPPRCVSTKMVLEEGYNTEVETPLSVDNNQVAKWKIDAPDTMKAQAYVSGKIFKIYPTRNGHAHFAIDILADNPLTVDQDETVRVELIYQENNHFGMLPTLKEGMEVQACGEFIPSRKETLSDDGRSTYPTSPVGAIVHWLHWAEPGSHDTGFVFIDGKYFGIPASASTPRPGTQVSDLAIAPPAEGHCFKVDERGIVRNPNYGFSGRPFKKFYGFARTVDGKVYKVLRAVSPDGEEHRGARFDSIEAFFRTALGIDPASLCGR